MWLDLVTHRAPPLRFSPLPLFLDSALVTATAIALLFVGHRTTDLSSGVAFGDFDRDGRVDAVVTRLNERPVLLRNIMGTGNHWLALRLVGARSNRDGIGARVTVRSGGTTQVNHVTTSTGYACSSELAMHFGLGHSSHADSIEIEWPSGSRQTITNVAADSVLTVREPPAP
jgi:enediyne biosynthesis protein E4